MQWSIWFAFEKKNLATSALPMLNNYFFLNIGLKHEM